MRSLSRYSRASCKKMFSVADLNSDGGSRAKRLLPPALREGAEAEVEAEEGEGAVKGLRKASACLRHSSLFLL